MDIATVNKVAKLARLRLSEAEAEKMGGELAGILKWVEQLSAVDTEGVPELSSVSHATLPWRADVVSDGHQAKAILANAKGADHGCFAVPKVIE